MAISVAQQVYHHSLRKDDKGSMVNKTKCAASHFKNDLKYALLGSTVAAAGIGAGCLVYKKPKIGIKAMKTAGDMVAGLGKALGKFKTKFVAVLPPLPVQLLKCHFLYREGNFQISVSKAVSRLL